MEKRARFSSWWLPYALILPQIAVTVVFFFWPAGQALYQSLYIQDAFGGGLQFVGLDNFRDLLTRGREEALCFSVSVEHLSSFVV